MELWNLENDKATFWENGKRCLAVRQKGTEATGTRMFEIVSERKDRRGLPLKILKELTIEEAKEKATDAKVYADVGEKKLKKEYYYSYGSHGKTSVFHTEELKGVENLPFIESLIEKVKKAGTFNKVCVQKRSDRKEDAGKNYINVEIEYSVDVVEGKIVVWKILSEKYWRGFSRYIGKRITGYTESPDGRTDSEVEEMYLKGSSDEPISDEEKAELREREIWQIEDDLPHIANTIREEIPGLYRPKGEGYKQTMAALIKIKECL